LFGIITNKVPTLNLGIPLVSIFSVNKAVLRGSRPVLSCENGRVRVGVSVKVLRPTDRSQNFGRTKSLSYSETGRSVKKNFGRTKSIIDSSIFHMKERAVNRVRTLADWAHRHQAWLIVVFVGFSRCRLILTCSSRLALTPFKPSLRFT